MYQHPEFAFTSSESAFPPNQNHCSRETRICNRQLDDLEPTLQRLLARAEKDDVIICTKMDRLGRNTADMIRVVDGCYKKGIAIRFLENGLSTEGTMGKMVIQILAALAETERERIQERTNDGRIVVLAANEKFGRKIHPRTPAALTFIR